jgi:SAM-dependent methyltransferase
MPQSVSEPDRQEEARIAAAYARRGAPERYSWFSPGHLFMMQERERRTLALLRRLGVASLHDRTVLEVGCGAGSWLRDLVKWGAAPQHVVGIDLLPERVAQARALSPAGMRIECGSAGQLDFADASFDLVLQATVFSSILDESLQRRVASELRRVVKPDGLILWYDFHVGNPRNPDVRGVAAREIRALFPGCEVELERLTLAPPLARALAPRSWALCSLLAMIPPLRTHYLGCIRTPRGGAG